MSAYAYAYSYSPGCIQAQRGFSTLTGAVRHLRNAVDTDAFLSRNEAAQVAHSAVHSLGEQVTAHGVTAQITKEEA